MGATDYGTQTITFDYKQPAKSEDFNKINYKLFPIGIYSGGILSKENASIIAVSPLSCFIQDSTSEVSVHIETENDVSISVSETTPYIILKYSWVNVETNYMDILAVAYADITTDDLIVGRCIYKNNILQTSFDYTRRDDPQLQNLISDANKLKVIPTEPYSNKVTVLAGSITAIDGVIDVVQQDTAAISNTTDGRIDLIYIDDSGSIQVNEGVDAVNPVVPEFGVKRVIAYVTRGSSATTVTGDDITIVDYRRGDAYATSFMKTMLDDADADTALTTLGFSSFGKTLIDDADAAAGRATLDAEKTITISTSDPSGGSDGDIWFKREV